MRTILPAVMPAAIVGVVLVALLAPAGAVAQDSARSIAVTGGAETQAAPDVADITAGVESQAATAAEALADNSAAMQTVFEALDEAGVAAEDRQTSQLDLSPVQESDSGDAQRPPVVQSYLARNMVTVRVRDVVRVGAVIDALTKAGANRLYGISFDVADKKAHLEAARRRAIEDARATALLYAEAAGVTLGPVITIRDRPSGGGPSPFRAEAMVASAPPVAGGVVSLSAEVEVVWGIE
jgi:hypothetical protein